MSIVPGSRLGKLEFYEKHADVWAGQGAAIGLDPLLCTQLQALTVTARSGYNGAGAAREEAKAATTTFYNGVRSMHDLGSDLLAAIKNYAETTNNPEVYALAQIPPPKTPGAIAPPGTPFEFRVGLLQSGAVKLSWKCPNPSGTQGTVYEVFRRIGSGGTFSYVGSNGLKNFTDETLPAGSASVTYQVTAVRSTRRGEPAQFTVNFGVGGGGQMVIANITDETGAGVKLAA